MNVRRKTCKSPSPTTNPGTKTKPDADDEAIELTVRELNFLLEGIDLWGNQPHKGADATLLASDEQTFFLRFTLIRC